MLWPGPDKASAHWTFDGLDAGGTLIREGGRLDLHITPVNLAAPAYGLGTNGKTNRWRLDGVNQYGYLSSLFGIMPQWRWFDNAPTTALTVGIVARWNAPAANDVIFSCLNAGPTRGMAVRLSTAERVQIAAYDAAGAISTCTMSADAPLTGRTRVVMMAMEQAGSLARAWVDGQGVAAAFAGSLLPVAYDWALLPALGSIPGGGNYHDGDFFAICIWPLIFTDSEAKAFSDYWRDRAV